MVRKKANPSEFRGSGNHPVKIRVKTQGDVVSQVAEIVARLVDRRPNFELIETSEIYHNRPPSGDIARVYLTFCVVRKD